MSKYHDDNSYASDPGGISLSRTKLKAFKKELPFFKRLFARTRHPEGMLAEHLRLGDSRAAMVMPTPDGLVIAAYTDELDCVALLAFPDRVARAYNLNPGDRLLTVNTYYRGSNVAPDLEHGEHSYHRYPNFYPLIAEFLSDDSLSIEHRKAHISEEEWVATYLKGEEKLNRKGLFIRNGNPYLSQIPASGDPFKFGR
ncbi:hypothetical protein Enr10x_37890 [Gimesia panareensis]|uniref:Uncharacterized protein n=1 Tax=Gimesia panareensis TaxID=2527978 RepID=A0A517QA49_9PLAN|nr:hypothetical protein [Gimesia panareensis]QDT28445.1 hypothetical protein Enr10x_37890 [Gimesia panareensis]